MNVWSWFAIPPVVLLAAYMGSSSVERSAMKPLAAAPEIQTLNLPPIINANFSYQKDGMPKNIQLAAFGIAVPQEVRSDGNERFAQPAKDLFKLESVLMAGNVRSATIDGKVYKQGDKLGTRYQLVKVEPSRVWVKGPLGREALRFPEFRDPVPTADVPPLALQTPKSAAPSPASGVAPAAGKADSEYRKILEMLKL